MWSVTIALLLGDCRWLRAASHWLLATGCWLLATDDWLLAARDCSRFPLIGCIAGFSRIDLPCRRIPAGSGRRPVGRAQPVVYTARSCTVHAASGHDVLNRGAGDRGEGAEVPG